MSGGWITFSLLNHVAQGLGHGRKKNYNELQQRRAKFRSRTCHSKLPTQHTGMNLLHPCKFVSNHMVHLQKECDVLKVLQPSFAPTQNFYKTDLHISARRLGSVQGFVFATHSFLSFFKLRFNSLSPAKLCARPHFWERKTHSNMTMANWGDGFLEMNSEWMSNFHIPPKTPQTMVL